MAFWLLVAADVAFCVWLVFLGGAERLEGTLLAGLLVDPLAPLAPATALKVLGVVGLLGSLAATFVAFG